jgi:hypothetical protein
MIRHCLWVCGFFQVENFFLAGKFFAIGELISHNIAMYDLVNQQWKSVGPTGIPGNSVRSISIFGSQLLVGGNFNTTNQDQEALIGAAVWHAGTESWQSLDGGIIGSCDYQNIVYSVLAINENQFIIGGSFLGAGMILPVTASPNVAYWNQTSWQSLGSINFVIPSVIYTMAVKDQKLFVGMMSQNPLTKFF